MVPYFQRRHRLNPQEIDPIKKTCYHRLFHFLEECAPRDLLEAAALFRVYYRLREHVTNRPSYPSHSTWEEISAYLSYGTVSEEEAA